MLLANIFFSAIITAVIINSRIDYLIDVMDCRIKKHLPILRYPVSGVQLFRSPLTDVVNI